MRRLVRRFYCSDEGATTVDWVLLTALVTSLALAAFGTVRSGAGAISAEVSGTVTARPTTAAW